MKKNDWCLPALLLLAAALRLAYLGNANFWTDEAWTLWLVRMRLSDILNLVRHIDFHPPLYYLFLHYWALIFGESPWTLRLPSVFFDLGTLLLIYSLTGRLAGRGAAIIAGLLYAISAAAAQTAQEARMYSMLSFFLFGSLFFLIRAAESGKYRYWLLYVMFSVFALYTHYLSLFFLAALSLGFLAALALSRLPHRRLLAWSWCLLIQFLLYLPWAAVLIERYFSRREIGLSGGRFEVLEMLSYTIYCLEAGYSNPYMRYHIPSLLLALAALAGLWLLRRQAAALLIGFALLLPPLLAAGFYLATAKQIFSPRHLVIMAAPLSLLLGCALSFWSSRPGWRILPLPLLFLYLMLNAVSLSNWYHNSYYQWENWKPVAALVRRYERPDDLIVVQTAHRYYPFSFAYHGALSVLPDNNLRDFRQDALAGKKRVWLVQNCADVTDPKLEVRDFFYTKGKALFTYREDNYLPTGKIFVTLFELWR
jgi:uncharacterized membrane protein